MQGAPEGKARLAVFDFDGTSIAGNSPVLLVSHLLRRKMLKKRVVFRILLWAAAYKLRLPQNEAAVRGLVFTAFEGKPAAELTPDELKAALTAQQESLAEGLRGLQADHLKLKQKTDRAKSLAKQADILTRQLAELDKQQFAATRRAANAKAGHAACLLYTSPSPRD